MFGFKSLEIPIKEDCLPGRSQAIYNSATSVLEGMNKYKGNRTIFEKGVELYSLNVGEQVTILERNKGYWLVEHPSHGTGWLSETTIVLCNPYIK